jgi:hypothetical protein
MVGLLLGVILFANGCHKEPRYTLGVCNLTARTLNDVSVSLRPEGAFKCGVLDPQATKYYEETPWPIPTEIILKCNDQTLGKQFEVQKHVALPKQFAGDIIIEIVRLGDELDFQLKQKAKQDK